ncbi:hypothetical protein AB0J40_10340 [Amycolatopsis sp. NPDC049691]|uniref:hypothetical protein n=1 Tax=Amycolatopsis sp. NPDC049691 TaxID=3155155 RepID=UPI003447FD89
MAGERMSTSKWAELAVLDKVEEVLRSVPAPDHHFGQPWVTAYQLTIMLDHRFPEVRAKLGAEIGGVGAGDHSFARYLANQLSSRIKASDGHSPIEGAYLSNENVASLNFVGPGEKNVTSSISVNADLSMFRIRRG